MSAIVNTTRKASFDVARPDAAPRMADVIMEIQRRTGEKYGAIVMAYAKLAIGPGKLSFRDFLRLGLYDPALREATDVNAFVGQRRNRDLCVAINYRHDWLGLLSNKVAALSYLAAYGFPTIPFAALYAPGVSAGGPAVLGGRAALRDFLARRELYPLFGKPVEGLQSLGTIGLRSLAADGQFIETSDGEAMPVDRFIDDIEQHYPAGYLFQPMARPHEKIAALCGEKLACVRLITGLTEDGPRVLRGCWKIPSGANVADNYWRPGNLLASLDLADGKILRAFSGNGLDLAERRVHPDSGAGLIGFEHPEWAGMVALALDGARLMRHVPLIGWDLACTRRGPIIVEMNEAPDFFLPQLADRRGMFDETFGRFEQFQRRNDAAFVKEARGKIAKL
jgi:hypothetical protein